MYQTVILVLLFIGILFVAINVTSDNCRCYTEQQVIYRYIPRTFEEEQLDPAYADDVHRVLFSARTPWIYGVEGVAIRRDDAIRNHIVDTNVLY